MISETRHGLVNWKYYPVIITSSIAVLIGFVALCTYCFRRKRYASQSDDASDELYIDFHSETKSISKTPLISDDERSPHFIPNFIPSKFKPTSPTSPDSPGHGQKALCIGSPPGESFIERMGVQPRNRDLGQSYESLHSISSSIPVEPDLPSDRGEELGSIYFNLSYDVYQLVLKLTIQKAVNLPAKDISGTSDPFVKVLLLPDKKHKLETRVKRKMLNPVWNEVFTFEGFPQQKLLQRTLYLQVLDYDRFSRNDPIGEVELPLLDLPLQSEPVPFVKKLSPCKRSVDYLGDLLISMCYNPTSSRITIVVMKCTNLKPMDITGSCDPYVKIYLLYAGKRIDKKKTQVKTRALDPVWNEMFEFDVSIDKIREMSFVLTVIDFDRILPNEAIGQVIIGYRTAGTSLKHWTEMMNHPRKTIAMWHKIIRY